MVPGPAVASRVVFALFIFILTGGKKFIVTLLELLLLLLNEAVVAMHSIHLVV